MPTKERRIKEAARSKAKSGNLDLPEHIKAAINGGEITSNISNHYQPTAVERLKGGLKGVDESGENWMYSAEIGQSGNSRKTKTLQRAIALRTKYEHLWGKPNAAGIITQRETKANIKISQRTVQRYIALLSENNT